MVPGVSRTADAPTVRPTKAETKLSKINCMKKSIIALVSVLSILGTCFFVLSAWLLRDTITRAVRFWELTPAQRQCAQQIAGKLAYIERQDDKYSVAIGYFVDDDYLVALYSIGDQERCDIEFQKKVGHLDIFGAGTSYEDKDSLYPKAIRKMNLGGDQSPEIYVWFDIYGPGKRTNAKHIFFAKQPNGPYEAVLSLELCVGISSVQILDKQTTPSIMVTNDRLCDWPPSDMQSYIEYSLSTGMPQVIRSWSTGEFR